MTRETALRQLLSEYETLRQQNALDLQQRMLDTGTRDPKIAELLSRREGLFAQGYKQAFERPAEALQITGALEAQLAQIHASLRERLGLLGLPDDYLQPQYRCAICQDTGYVGEPVRQLCSCLEQRLLRSLYQEQGLAALSHENFEAFDLTVFSDQVLEGQRYSQRTYMQRIRELCEQYADTYPGVAQKNLLFFGPSGLGKSFLMNCIAQRVLSRGQAVMRISAYELFTRMRAVHFGADPAEQTTPLFTVPLLLIDDLGTEPMMDNVTIPQMFALLNGRQVAQKGTILSTNFSLLELKSAYTERIFSRLMDQKQTQLIEFFGEDVRKRRF